MSVGDRIKALREGRGLSTTDLSQLTGISQSTISKLENGKRKAEIALLEKIASALNVYVEYLTGASASSIIKSKLEELGMTQTELSKKAHVPLKFKEEDIVGDTVHVYRSINAYGEITGGKNKNARRKFVLTEMAKEVLEDQRALNVDSEYVFGDISLYAYSQRFIKYCKHNGIPHTTLYELRHTFISIAKTLSEGQIKPIVGHSQNMDTFGVYGHELDGELKETAQDINRIFANLLESDVKNECVL